MLIKSQNWISTMEVLSRLKPMLGNGGSVEGRAKKIVKLTDSKESKTIVISWPEEWPINIVRKEIKNAIRGIIKIKFGDNTDEFPDLELMESGTGLSFVHIA